jgi:nitrite reductase/ring-hydroxylating ferredoxin subunit
MFSDKTKLYRIAASKGQLLDQMQSQDECLVVLPFGEVIVKLAPTGLVAFRNECPHQKLKLQGCHIENNHVVCPWHKYAFQLEHGRGHGLYLEVFPVIENNEGVFIKRTYFSWFGE